MCILYATVYKAYKSLNMNPVQEPFMGRLFQPVAALPRQRALVSFPRPHSKRVFCCG